MGLVFIDFKKAFDTVDYDILCEKRQIYGVQQRELSWFRSYLSNRKQFCRVNGVTSDMQDVEVGVPQGSCLGPLLFLIYINDLPLAVQGSTASMYADETSLCHQALNMTQLNGAINNDLKRLDTWLQGNKLSLNVTKTNSMLITTKQKRNVLKSTNQNLQLNIRGNELDIVQKTKYLGVQIDCSLDWKEQIKVVSAKVSRAIGFLKHAKKFLPRVVSTNFSLSHMNIRSLSCHFDDLYSLLVNLNVKFDVVGVSETWDSIKNPVSTNVNISGYSFFFTKSKSQNGGVGLYIKTGLGPVPRPDMNASTDHYETVWVEIENTKDKTILICCAYRHPS